MPEPRTYHIETLADLLELDPDVRERCIAELGYWCAAADLMLAGIGPASVPVMIWTDDGKRHLTIRVSRAATATGTGTEPRERGDNA
jgi:hypothetical protein